MGVHPALSLEPKDVRVGGALSLEYRWTLTRGAQPVPRGYSAFVHFVDESGALIFADDHVPFPSPADWEPGKTYSYRRTVLIPDLVPPCAAEVRMGLFSPAAGRLALQGLARARDEYLGARLQILPRDGRERVVFGDGWYPPEALPGDPFVPRRWMGREAHAAFPNRGQDVVVLLSAQTNHVFPETPRLTLAVGNKGATLPLLGSDLFFERLRFTAGDLGNEGRADLRLALSESFVPRLLGLGNDPRELSLWVHGLLVEEVRDVPAVILEGAREALPLPGLEVHVAPTAPRLPAERPRGQNPAE